jgi:hypothetical protein
MDENQTAFDRWQADSKPMVRNLTYWTEQNMLTFFDNENRCVAEPVGSNLVLYRDIDTKQIIGFRIDGVTQYADYS